MNGGTEVANDADSQTVYGISTLTLDNLLMDSDADALALANFLVNKYAQPEYRFESVSIVLDTLSGEDREKMLNIELGDFVNVKLTPNNIPPAISRLAEVIRVSQSVTPSSHLITLGLGSFDFRFFTLSDSLLGRLSEGNSLAY